MSRRNPIPTLTICHGNRKGTGGALRVSLRPAAVARKGVVTFAVAEQGYVEDGSRRDAGGDYFVWPLALEVRLAFADVAKVLQVLRGECRALEDGNGFVFPRQEGHVRFTVRRIVQPIHGCALAISHFGVCGRRGETRQILLDEKMAEGLYETLVRSMFLLGFGVPVLADDDYTEDDFM